MLVFFHVEVVIAAGLSPPAPVNKNVHGITKIGYKVCGGGCSEDQGRKKLIPRNRDEFKDRAIRVISNHVKGGSQT